MALVSLREDVLEARRDGRAVPLFVCGDMDGVLAIAEACEETGLPAMLGMWGGLIEGQGGAQFAEWARSTAESRDARLSLMLDHGRSVQQCRLALDLGFTDVMFDGSKRPLEENLAMARRVAQMAHERGAGMEGELGIVGHGSDYEEFGARGQGLTDVDEAARFAQDSGCDILAVAVGTAHGQYNAEPRLDLERLDAIAARVDVPLAMHGGSGLSAQQYRDAIRHGVAKINIGTDLFISARNAMARAVAGADASYFALRQAAREAIRARAEHYLNTFAGRV